MTSPADLPSSAVVAPTVDPTKRVPEDVQPAGDYRREDRVWVRPPGSHSWRPGLVEGAAPLAVIVRYLPMPGRAQAVDTVTPIYVMPRSEYVPDIDPPGPHEPGS